MFCPTVGGSTPSLPTPILLAMKLLAGDYPVRSGPRFRHDSGVTPGHHYDAGLSTASPALPDNRGHPDAVEDRRSHADSEEAGHAWE
jgi:hypothetical protein